MEKNSHQTRQIVLICSVIIVAFLASAFMFVVSSSKNTRAFIEQATDMTAANVITQIESDMSASVYTARAMATNPFIINWAGQEAANADNTDYIKELYTYLKAYYEGNNYNFVFYASEVTGNCYYQDGMKLTLSKQNEDDRWIYDFMDSDLQYQFIVNPFKPKNDSNNSSMLIIYRLNNSSGGTLGVIGVSLSLRMMENSILELGSNYDVGIAFTDTDGNVVISEDYSLPVNSNVFSESGLFYGKDVKLIPVDGAVTRIWLGSGFLDADSKFCEIRYLDDFNRYLIIYGSGSGAMKMHNNQLFLQLGMLAVLLILMIAVIINTISQYRSKIISLATLDELTKIMNRKSFMSRFDYFSKQQLLENSHLFLIDIDFFKTINDTLGHAAGDEALSYLSSVLTAQIENNGFVARWGGDEFIGVLFSAIDSPVDKLNDISSIVSNSDTGKRLHITLSIGVATLDAGDTLNTSVEKADIALYTSKKNGRNRTTLYDASQTGAEPEYSKELKDLNR